MTHLSTGRLTLRPPELSDAQAIFSGYAQDPEVTRYLTWEPHSSIEESRRFLKSCQRGWEAGDSLSWAIVAEEGEEMMGMIGARPRGFKVNIGYVLARPFWNKGYMTEAAEAVVDLMFRRREVYRVWAICDIENAASARVMEKVGMTREGVLRRWIIHPNISEEPRDCLMYARVR